MSHREVSLGFQIVDLARLFRHQFERAVADSGLALTAGEARTLLHAAKSGPIRQTDLAWRMAVEPMSLSNFLDRLEARDLVARVPDPRDRRAKQVRLTAGSTPLVARLQAIAASVLDRATAGLGANDQSALREGLERMRDNLTAPARGTIR